MRVLSGWRARACRGGGLDRPATRRQCGSHLARPGRRRHVHRDVGVLSWRFSSQTAHLTQGFTEPRRRCRLDSDMFTAIDKPVIRRNQILLHRTPRFVDHNLLPPQPAPLPRETVWQRQIRRVVRYSRHHKHGGTAGRSDILRHSYSARRNRRRAGCGS